MGFERKVEWVDLKKIAHRFNMPYAMQHSCVGNICTVSLNISGNIYECIMKTTTDEYKDFQINYMPHLVSPTDNTGKLYVRNFSANQAEDTICFTTKGDDFANSIVGEGVDIAWDASAPSGDPLAFDNDTTKIIDVNFIDGIRIFGGTLYWENGDINCLGDCMVVCPNGALLTVVDGSPIYADSDVVINWYARSLPMMGSNPAGSTILPEAASEKVPTNYGWIVRIKITKPASNTTFRGRISLIIYRKSNV